MEITDLEGSYESSEVLMSAWKGGRNSLWFKSGDMCDTTELFREKGLISLKEGHSRFCEITFSGKRVLLELLKKFKSMLLDGTLEIRMGGIKVADLYDGDINTLSKIIII